MSCENEAINYYEPGEPELLRANIKKMVVAPYSKKTQGKKPKLRTVDNKDDCIIILTDDGIRIKHLAQDRSSNSIRVLGKEEDNKWGLHDAIDFATYSHSPVCDCGPDCAETKCIPE